MKNSFGSNVTYTIFGESHGPYIGIVIDGLCPGISIDYDYIEKQMAKRKAYGSFSTARHEEDKVEIVSGVFDGKTTGTPLTILIANKNVHKNDYDKLKNIARPSHGDYTQYVKSLGNADLSGGGHASGRLTAVIVAAAAIIRPALEAKGIYVGSHILSLHGIEDEHFSKDVMHDIEKLDNAEFPVLNPESRQKMIAEIEKIKAENDSTGGGILETIIHGLPAGIGEPFFDSLESIIAHLIFAVPGVKGIEFGSGFHLAEMKGSQANDQLAIRDGKVVTLSNHNGGINAGISNGMDILFNTVIKPTPSIGLPQKTVDFVEMEEKEITISGRHDPSIIQRARAVVEAMSVIAVNELLSQRYGYLYLGEKR